MLSHLDTLAEFESRVKASREVALLADFDGTLAPIVPHPHLARLPTRLRSLLEQLRDAPGLTVGIISGRSLSDLKAPVRIDGILYAGNHGLEMEGPGFHFVHPAAVAAAPALHTLAGALGEAMSGLEGAWVEDKGYTLSLHYRQVQRGGAAQVKDIFQRLTAPWRKGGAIRTTRGKKTLEVCPPTRWGKGKAVDWLADQLGWDKACPPPLILYLGDDLTDEEAFAAVATRGGVAIRVGAPTRSTKASWCLPGTAEVEGFLEKLVVLRRVGGHPQTPGRGKAPAPPTPLRGRGPPRTPP